MTEPTPSSPRDGATAAQPRPLSSSSAPPAPSCSPSPCPEITPDKSHYTRMAAATGRHENQEIKRPVSSARWRVALTKHKCLGRPEAPGQPSSRQSAGISVGRVPQRPPHVRCPRPLHPRPCWPAAKSDDPSAEARPSSPSSCATRDTVVPHRLDPGPRESTGWGTQDAAPSCAQDHLLCRPL